MLIIYFLIILIATTFGAIAGLGGGVIIKPLLDLIGFHDASTIGFYSCIAVFTMCIVSIIKQIKQGFRLDVLKVVYISIGSYIGGLIGEIIFNNLTSQFENSIVKLIQSSLLLITLIFILIYTLNQENIKRYSISNLIYIVLIGIFLGSISVFLGIGGGPLNVSVLILLFSFDMKDATIYSIATIFFSQLSKLISIVMSGELIKYDLSFLPFICISAIVGGYIGTQFNQKMNNETIKKVYIKLMYVLIGISIYNIMMSII